MFTLVHLNGRGVTKGMNDVKGCGKRASQVQNLDDQI
jgi:hypothetical protein